VPCLSLLVNPVGLAVGIWILVLAINGDNRVGIPVTVLAAVNVVAALCIILHNWINSWRVSRLVLDARRSRLTLAFRLNPLFVMAYWVFWVIAIVIGIQMFIRDKGLVWERTEKIDANHDLVRGLELVNESASPMGSVRSEAMATQIDLHGLSQEISGSDEGAVGDRSTRPRTGRGPRPLPDARAPVFGPFSPGYG
jgi:hypothetical protein